MAAASAEVDMANKTKQGQDLEAVKVFLRASMDSAAPAQGCSDASESDSASEGL